MFGRVRLSKVERFERLGLLLVGRLMDGRL